MELQVLGAKTKKCELNPTVFSTEFNEPLVHQIVTAYLAGARAGTKAQKTRAEVRGGGTKPWRQKGTGRARAGTIRSPLWRKGGKVFAAKPRTYDQKVNKKMYRNAMRAILSELIRQERVIVVNEFVVDTFKTKEFLAKLTALTSSPHVLLITDVLDEKLYLAARNLSFVEVCDVAAINPISLINKEKLLITLPALKQVEELLK